MLSLLANALQIRLYVVAVLRVQLLIYIDCIYDVLN